METIKLQAQIGTDGILQIQTPTNFKNTSVEIVVLIQLINNVIAPSEEAQPRYNAWGKKTTKKSITEARSANAKTTPRKCASSSINWKFKDSGE
ncbi:hypothetical protein [Iningainema tapete]|uniref:hypothetical protein n=1 Tax=Iningainema tapete TaxID=2806730 RepID=UPI001EE259FD|nr:hypothetical protein [Iningainema tapete]